MSDSDKTIHFVDQDSGANASVIIREFDRIVALGIIVHQNGDLDVAFTAADAVVVANALLEAASRVASSAADATE